MKDHYLPVVVAALVVLVLGCLNPVVLQHRVNGKPSGQPSYMWLSFMALLAGLLTCYLMHGNHSQKGSGRGSQLALGEYL